MSYARTRFASALAITVSGTVLGVGAFVFSPVTERWLGLGVGAGALAVLVVAFTVRGRGALQRGLDALLVPICAWAIVSSRTLELSEHAGSVAVVRWLSFSAGAAIAAIGLLSLIAHELGTEADLRWAFEQLTAPQSEAEHSHDHNGTNGNADWWRWSDEVSRTPR